MLSSKAKLDRTHATLNRLIQELRDDGNDGPSAGDYRHSHTFDLVGNRLGKTIDLGDDGADDEVIRYTCKDRDQLLTETSTITGQTTYAYDANGSTISVTTPSGTQNYRWDLRHRLAGLDADGDGQFSSPTGYSQVLEEWTSPDGLAPAALDRSYLIGQDVIAQMALATQYLLYDDGGHTCGLLDPTGQPLSNQIYAYDAHGNRLDDPSNPITPATTLLYRGEYFDTLLGSTSCAPATTTRSPGGSGASTAMKQALPIRWGCTSTCMPMPTPSSTLTPVG